MHHTLEGLKRRYEAVRKGWHEESRGRTRLQKRRQIGKDHQESAARGAESYWRIGDNTTAIATELTQDGVRIVRRQLTALECTVSVVYPGSEKPGVPGTTSAATLEGDASQEQCTTQTEMPERPKAEEQTKHSTNDEAETTSASEEFPFLPASLLSSGPEDHTVSSPVATRRTTSASSSLTFPSAFSAPEEPLAQPQLSTISQTPPQGAVQLPTSSVKEDGVDKGVTAANVKTEPYVSRMHSWLYGLQRF